jgi:hypothetical protein
MTENEFKLAISKLCDDISNEIGRHFPSSRKNYYFFNSNKKHEVNEFYIILSIVSKH